MSLARLLFSIMVLKAKPQDIPFDFTSMVALVAVYAASGVFVISSTLDIDIDIAIYSMMLDAVVLSLFSVVCLELLELKPRWVQTFAALFGTGIFFNLLAWPIFEELSKTSLSEADRSTLLLLSTLLISWQIVVNAHVYRNALSVDMIKAVVLSVAYWLMSMTLSQIIIPAS